ncbi:M23 family metallopeptidase [Sandaracinus amylolyticus]|uniref:M23 family metallopeptidase n=1 Tax=Sandaracinus amylolyticus TaxID=927083 RepID=UPI001F1CB35F|nr:M23 family metallopeptidase [Sandaracinus amylolyticus]UJR81338.1 M23 peptidase domain-containing protein [Sandaracinus amylolyticus]
MADETPSGIPTHRPLPSVGMPLLRDDVRTTRQKQLLAVVVLVALAAVTIAVVALVPGPPQEGEGAEVPSADEGPAVPLAVGFSPPHDAGPLAIDAGPPAPPPEPLAVESTGVPGGTRTTHAFGRAVGFRPALTNSGVSGADADALTTALTGVLDFRRCRPEHQIVLERDADGSLTRFEYRASITQIYEAVRDGARWLGRQVEVPVQRTRLSRGGTVATSLGAALEGAGLGRAMVGTFVETFDGRIDFNTETRAGDAFRILLDEERIDGQFLGYGTVWAIEYRSQRRGVLRAFWFETRAAGGGRPAEGDFHDETGRAVHGGWLRTPLRYDHISSPFNPRRMHPVLRRVMPHNGIDYAAGTGTPVWAAADGTITFIGPRGANGNLVALRHEGGYETFYAHLSRFAPGLSRGDTVTQRQVIGYVGSTGRSTGPHLHFGLKRHGGFVDPGRELNGPGRMLPAAQMGRFRAQLAGLRRELDAIEIPEVAVREAPDAHPVAASEDVMD